MVINRAFSLQVWVRFAQCAICAFGVFLFIPLSPDWIHAQNTTKIFPSASQKAKNGPIPVRLIISQHRRIIISEAIQRVAVGDTDMVSAQLINNREVLLLGHQAGRTTMIVWLKSGRIKQYICNIEQDLSVLQAALTNIHPNIRVSSAPDREALVLTGTVPAITHSLSAEAITQKYLDAGASRNVEDGVGPVVKGQEPARSDGKTEKASEGERSTSTDGASPDTVSLTSSVRSSGTIINLIQVESLPLDSVQRIQDAIQSIGGENVQVRRVQRGQAPDDALDVFLLEGTVKNQVALLRVLEVASRILTGEGTNRQNIRVIGNEAGGLERGRNQQSQQAGLLGGGAGGTLGQLFGGGGGNRGRIQNLVRQNLARAKAIEAANGRILSFITVVDLPQVRVNVKLYELNRTKLRSYSADFFAVHDNFSGFITPPTSPSVQNVLGAFAGTAISEQFIRAGSFAVESLLIVLEQLDIARSLSSPSITVLSGEMAQFLVGGQIPITTVFSPAVNIADNPNNQFFRTITFTDFGVSLQVRPLVEENGDVTLDLRPQVITPDPELTVSIRDSSGSEQNTTAFKTRTLSSTSRLKDGEALIVAGLLSRDKSDIQRFIPGLGDSILNWVFRKFDQNDEETDLVMVVNPVIIREPNPKVRLWAFPDHPEFALPINTHPPAVNVPEPMS